MVEYYCKHCDIKTDLSECPNCHQRTELKGSSIFWCDECHVPLYEQHCSLCGKKAKRIATDIRPVFPEERLLMEIVLGTPLKYKDCSVWSSASNFYFVDGQRVEFNVADIQKIGADKIRDEIEKYSPDNDSASFDLYIDRFIRANQGRCNYITSEACSYIRTAAKGYGPTEMFVSMSGGKDSTVVSSLVRRALSSEEILHIYGDTTLEFPETKKYINEFRRIHPKTPLLVAINKDKDFEDLCTKLGPPSRVMRWCCTVFKTGAIQRKITTLFRNKKRVLTFMGLRRNESNSRSKYDRDANSPKITIQKTSCPIIDWFDFDIWLYLLTNKVEFNQAYKLGYTRVGCWCCPNNSQWSNYMSQVYMPEQYSHFRDVLIAFAKEIGKPDPEEYIDSGNWKARQGGNGMQYAQKSVITFEPCATQENTINFELQRPITEELYEFFKPFGIIDKTIGNSRLGEVYVTDRDHRLLLKLQGRMGTKNLKVSFIDKNAGRSQSLKVAEEKVKCQITKYQMCMGCLACESICKHGAISIVADKDGLVSYRIIDDKCVRCGECITHYDGGCYMRRVMCIKRG